MKFTSGIGSLAFAGLFGELYAKVIPPWIVIGVSLAPLVIFLLIQPGEMPVGFVRVSQVFASLWYLSVATYLVAQAVFRQPQPRGLLFYIIMTLPGVFPCAVVLWRTFMASTHWEDSNLVE